MSSVPCQKENRVSQHGGIVIVDMICWKLCSTEIVIEFINFLDALQLFYGVFFLSEAVLASHTC